MKHESDDNTNCNRRARYSNQRFSKGTEKHADKTTSEDHPHYSFVGIDQKKSSGDLTKLAVTQTPVKDYQLTLM